MTSPGENPSLTRIFAAERLDLPAEKTIVFEDSKSGVTSAVAAGAFCVGIGGVELIPCGARLAIPDFTGVEVISRLDGNTAISFCPDHILIIDKKDMSQASE